MRCILTGVGEAFDERESNTSVLVDLGGDSVLLDCGFTAASRFFALADKPLELDAVNISHFHGDHWFGLPALLTRFCEHGRTKPLAVMGPGRVEERVRLQMDLAYPGLLDRAAFPIRFVDTEPGVLAEAGGFAFSFAPSDHSVPCLAVRVERDGKAVFFSGDGRPTDESTALARGCGLAVHESYNLEPETAGHGTVDGCLEFAGRAGVGVLALVHVQRDIRRARKAEIEDRLARAVGFTALLPEAGREFAL